MASDLHCGRRPRISYLNLPIIESFARRIARNACLQFNSPLPEGGGGGRPRGILPPAPTLLGLSRNDEDVVLSIERSIEKINQGARTRVRLSAMRVAMVTAHSFDKQHSR